MKIAEQEAPAARDIDYIQFIVVDLFCGAGGTTLGFEKAKSTYEDMYAFLKSVGIDPPSDKETFFQISKVIACVNHDPIAIKSHWKNHRHVNHFEEDIRHLNPYGGLKYVVDVHRALYPHAKLILWASLECTNFSKAKGGEGRDQDSRTLALELYKYIHALNPDYIFIENVVEFMAWGPMVPKIQKKDGYESCVLKIKRKKGKVVSIGPSLIPESKKNGKDWMRWRERICSFGYQDEWRQMNAADFGAITSRNRLFGCFAKSGLPIVWPRATHAKNPQKTTLAEPLQKWNAVKVALDFDDEGRSVFNRKKKLSTKTFQRLAMGCVKHIAGGKKEYQAHQEHFLLKFFSGKPEHKNASIENPSPSITTFGGGALVKAERFIAKHFGGSPEDKNSSVEDPLGTITTKDHNAIVKACFIDQRNGGDPEHKSRSIEEPAKTLTSTGGNQQLIQAFITKWNSSDPVTGGHAGHSIYEPAPVVTTQNRLGLASINFISRYNGVNGGKHDNSQSVEGPVGALGTHDSQAKVSAFFLDKSYRGEHNHQSIEQPAGSILTNDKHRLVEAEKFLMNTNYNNLGSTLEEPAPTLTASRRHHYIVNPSWYGNSGSIEEPCFVVVARQDKAPLYLITCTKGPIAIPIYEDDCEWTVELKKFMVLYGICDIKMRMLKVPELKKIQGFPESYILEGNQTDQKKFIGNAVHPYIPKFWIEAFSEKFTYPYRMAA